MMKRLVPVVCASAMFLALAVSSPATASVIKGTRGADTLVGTAKADVIRGFGGNDTLRGKHGGDSIYGGAGNDRIQPGDDAQKDLIYGGCGRDRMVVSFFDHAYAGPGNDTVLVKAEGTEVFCGPGHDKAVVFLPRSGWGFVHFHGCEVKVKAS